MAIRSDVVLALEHVTAQELRVQGARRTMALHNQLADNTATTRSTEVRTLQHLEASMAELQSALGSLRAFQQRQQCETAIERLHAIIQEDREQRLRSESLFERMLADDVAAFRKDLSGEGDEWRAKEEMLGRLASEVATTVRAELAQERRSRHDVLAHLFEQVSRSQPRRSPPACHSALDGWWRVVASGSCSALAGWWFAMGGGRASDAPIDRPGWENQNDVSRVRPNTDSGSVYSQYGRVIRP